MLEHHVLCTPGLADQPKLHVGAIATRIARYTDHVDFQKLLVWYDVQANLAF